MEFPMLNLDPCFSKMNVESFSKSGGEDRLLSSILSSFTLVPF